MDKLSKSVSHQISLIQRSMLHINRRCHLLILASLSFIFLSLILIGYRFMGFSLSPHVRRKVWFSSCCVDQIWPKFQEAEISGGLTLTNIDFLVRAFCFCCFDWSDWASEYCKLHSLSLLNFWRILRRIDQGFPHIGVCPWLVPHLVSLAGATSCVLLCWLVFCDLCLCSICILLSCWGDY